MLDTHRVSLDQLDAMAEGRSSLAVVELLKKAYRSRQLVILRAVLDRTLGITTPLPPLEEAWSLLAAVQRRDEAAVDTVITHPRTGWWTATLLRLLNRDDGEQPLWTHLGYLHQMAAAAAVRAGHDFHMCVPVWRGTVMLPTLGVATVPSETEWDVTEVRGSGGHVTIGDVQIPDGPGWLALRTLRAGGFQVCLDDIDPYREFYGPMPPRRLPADEVAAWSEGLRHTWQLLSDHHPETAAELASGLTTLVPCTAEGYSASHNDAFGSVALSLPPDPTTFAETLVHEFQHNKLGVLLSLVDLLDPKGDNETPRLYAPWRDDPRPPTGLLHGVVSFLGVAAFYHNQSIVDDRPIVRFEFEYHRMQTSQAVETLLNETTPSELGHRFLSKARDQLQKWATVPLPDHIREAARRATDDHRLSWRIRHLRPREADVMADAWLNKRAKPVVEPTEPRLTPSAITEPNTRLALIRSRLSTSDQTGTLVNGDNETAVELYRQQILARPESATAWAGLALASEDKTLQTRPELVFSVYQEIGSHGGTAHPLRLAEWLG
jgi:HEXXH motif-containing protein